MYKITEKVCLLYTSTYECDASQTYKDVLLAAKPEDVRIIHSPVGMPGRALNTPLVQALAKGKRFAPRHLSLIHIYSRLMRFFSTRTGAPTLRPVTMVSLSLALSRAAL